MEKSRMDYSSMTEDMIEMKDLCFSPELLERLESIGITKFFDLQNGDNIRLLDNDDLLEVNNRVVILFEEQKKSKRKNDKGKALYNVAALKNVYKDLDEYNSLLAKREELIRQKAIVEEQIKEKKRILRLNGINPTKK